MSAFGDVANIVPLQIWEGATARAWSGERAALAAIVLEPHSVVPEHSHDNEQTGILIHGRLTFRIGSETKELSAGATWVVTPNTPHEVEAGEGGATLIELFAPPRTDWNALPSVECGPIAPFG